MHAVHKMRPIATGVACSMVRLSVLITLM